MEDSFLTFEDRVLPLLQKHHGALLYRVRPVASSVIESQLGQPYEVHLVSFATRADFEAYRDDPERQQYLPLKDAAIDSALLIEGKLL